MKVWPDFSNTEVISVLRKMRKRNEEEFLFHIPLKKIISTSGRTWNRQPQINLNKLKNSLKIPKYKLGYVAHGFTAFKVQKDGCSVPSAARALIGPEGL